MSTIKNGQIWLYCHFNKIIKGPETNFQSQALSQKYVIQEIEPRNVCHTAHKYLTKFHFDSYLGFKRNEHKCKFYDVAMSMMTPKILKSADFAKTQK